MTLSGILWCDLIAYSLFVTYDICGRVGIGNSSCGVVIPMLQLDFTDCYWFTFHKGMLVITLLLHMLYVIGYFHSLVLMVRYYSLYTIVAYNICGIASVARYFG